MCARENSDACRRNRRVSHQQIRKALRAIQYRSRAAKAKSFPKRR
ncbi:hypothetical protein BSIN_1398 [Burkholderia singularis]|uniref:Uncharacterized protein n=1 Tax=Burkholderia singularis TaxID=1503053 RepID=A0A238GYN9_9BURK|nr:hypothetical protein BSIN_1398 [Burkholderia singularis]